MFDTPIKEHEIEYDDRYTIHGEAYRTGVTLVYIYDDIDFKKVYQGKYIFETWEAIEDIIYSDIMPDIIASY
jgi:hypothetical protein